MLGKHLQNKLDAAKGDATATIHQRRQFVLLAILTVGLIAVTLSLPSGAPNPNSKAAREATLKRLVRQESYYHAVGPELPAPPPFQENPEAFANVVDMTAEEKVENDIDPAALAYAAHQVFATDETVGANSAQKVEYLDLVANPTGYRGRWLRFTGQIEFIGAQYDRILESGNPAGLDKLYGGYAVNNADGVPQKLYFLSVGYPLNMYPKEEVQLEGIYLQHFFNADTTDSVGVAPLLVVKNLRRIEPEAFELDDALLERVVNDADLRMATEISKPGLAYCLHKIATATEQQHVVAVGAGEDLFQSASKYRGQTVELRGVFLQGGRTVVEPNAAHMRNVYEGFVGNVNGVIFHFYSVDPPLFSQGDDVILRGVFLQLYSYTDQQNNRVAAPVIIAQRLQGYSPVLPRKNDPVVVVAGIVIFLVLLAVVVLAAIDRQRSNRESAMARIRFRPAGFSIQEVAKQARKRHDEDLGKGHSKAGPGTVPPNGIDSKGTADSTPDGPAGV